MNLFLKKFNFFFFYKKFIILKKLIISIKINSKIPQNLVFYFSFLCELLQISIKKNQQKIFLKKNLKK